MLTAYSWDSKEQVVRYRDGCTMPPPEDRAGLINSAHTALGHKRGQSTVLTAQVTVSLEGPIDTTASVQHMQLYTCNYTHHDHPSLHQLPLVIVQFMCSPHGPCAMLVCLYLSSDTRSWHSIPSHSMMAMCHFHNLHRHDQKPCPMQMKIKGPLSNVHCNVYVHETHHIGV